MHPTKKSTAKRVGGGLMASAAALALTLTGTTAQAAAPPIATAVAGPTPEAQAWVDQNPFGMFLHYGPGTYSGAQWSDPNLPPTVFAPTATVDTDQWAASMKAAGMTFGVLTAKHHDGFALWPTAHSTYDIASSGYQGGQGDIVRDYVDSMREAGLKVGIYFSIWDQKNGNSTQLIKNQLQELLTQYGQIDYLWFDGWGWKIPYGDIPYQPIRDHIRALSPNTIVANNDHQSTFDTTDVMVWEVPAKGFPPNDARPKDASNTLSTNPTEWFTMSTSSQPRPALAVAGEVAQMNSGNSLYLLNVGPGKDGKIPANYVSRLTEIGKAISDPTWLPPAGSNQVYTSVSSNKCISVNGASTANGAIIDQWACYGVSNQRWTRVDVGGGYFKLQGTQSGKCLDVPGGSTAEGAAFDLWDCAGNEPQEQFSLKLLGGGQFQLVVRHTGKCLTVQTNSSADGARLVQATCGTGANQKWRIS